MPIDRAVHAAFYMEPAILNEMLSCGRFNTMLLNNVRDCGVEGMFPIQYITKCWDIVLRPEGFAEEYRDFVKWLRLRNSQVKDFFLHWGFDLDKLNIQFWNYDQIYTFFDDEPDKFIESAVYDYSQAGTREKDVRLYMAGMKWNIPKVKELLADDADMRAPIYNDDIIHSLETDLCQEANAMNAEVFYLIQDYWENPDYDLYNLLCGYDSPLCRLFSWAGYETVMQTIAGFRDSLLKG